MTGGMTAKRWAVRAAMAGALALTVSVTASCSGEPVGRVAADTPLSRQCGTVPEGARRAVVPAADGTRLGAAVLGRVDAPVGLVLAYGQSQTLCDWLEEARRLADQADARVLILDRRGNGSGEGEPDPAKDADDVQSAVQFLRSGTDLPVVLLGSSRGSGAAVAGSTGAGNQKPCATVVISPAVPPELLTDVRRGLPPLWVATETGNGAVVRNAEELLAAARVGKGMVRELRVPGTDHSIGLVQRHADVRDFLLEPLRQCSQDIRLEVAQDETGGGAWTSSTSTPPASRG